MNIRNEAGRMLSIDRVSENYVLGNVNDVQLHYPSSIFVVCRLPLLPSTPKEHIASATLSQTLHFCHFLKHLPCFFFHIIYFSCSFTFPRDLWFPYISLPCSFQKSDLLVTLLTSVLNMCLIQPVHFPHFLVCCNLFCSIYKSRIIDSPIPYSFNLYIEKLSKKQPSGLGRTCRSWMAYFFIGQALNTAILR